MEWAKGSLKFNKIFSLLAIGLAFTIGVSLVAVYGEQLFEENITVDNGSGSTFITAKSSTGHAGVLFDDVGEQVYAIGIPDGTEQFWIFDFDAGEVRMIVHPNGDVCIGDC